MRSICLKPHESFLAFIFFKHDSILQILFLFVEIDILQDLVLFDHFLRLLDHIFNVLLWTIRKFGNLVAYLWFGGKVRRPHVAHLCGGAWLYEGQSGRISQKFGHLSLEMLGLARLKLHIIVYCDLRQDKDTR